MVPVGNRRAFSIPRTWGGSNTTPSQNSLTIAFQILSVGLRASLYWCPGAIGSAGCGQARGLGCGLGLVGVGNSWISSSLDSSSYCRSEATDSFAVSTSPELVSEVPATFAAGRSSGRRSSSLAARGRLSNGWEGIMRAAHDLQEHCHLLRYALKFGLQIYEAKCHS